MFQFGQPKPVGSIVVVSDDRVNTKTFCDDDDEVLAGSVQTSKQREEPPAEIDQQLEGGEEQKAAEPHRGQTEEVPSDGFTIHDEMVDEVPNNHEVPNLRLSAI
jgi:hypothetical protein